jgi:hypothetical protein
MLNSVLAAGALAGSLLHDVTTRAAANEAAIRVFLNQLNTGFSLLDRTSEQVKKGPEYYVCSNL